MDHMRACVGLCNALDREDEMEDTDCMAMGMSAPRFKPSHACLCAPAFSAQLPHHHPAERERELTFALLCSSHPFGLPSVPTPSSDFAGAADG
jgi:hypothetical protein